MTRGYDFFKVNVLEKNVSIQFPNQVEVTSFIRT